MRVAIYARVSSQRQQERETIASQVEALRAYVSTNEHSLFEKHVFLDDGYSGTTLDRPGLDSLRDIVRERVVEAVVAHSPDRLARKYAYQVLLIDEFEKFGCQILFLNQPPPTDPESRLLVDIQGVVAEYERCKIIERMRRGKIHKARQGWIVQSRAPYGYTHIPRDGAYGARYEIDEERAPMIREIFDWVGREGLSIRQVTKRLNESRWYTRNGKKTWNPATVKNILSNETYIGVAYYNRLKFIRSDRTDNCFRKNPKTKCIIRPAKEWIPIPVPAIISKDTFLKARAQLKTNTQFSPRNLRRKDEYLLRCLVKCGVCGLRMVAHSYGRHTYYDCSGGDSLSTGRDSGCPSTSVYAPNLDKVVWEEIRTLLSNPEILIEAFHTIQHRDISCPPDSLEQEMQRLDRCIRKAGKKNVA